MKITGIRIFRVYGEKDRQDWEGRVVRLLDVYPEYAAEQKEPPMASANVAHLYVEVTTDEGTSGKYGPIDMRQAFLAATELRDFLIGADPLAIEELHDKMLRLNIHGRSGLFVTSISAINNALWDLRGKALGEPVYRLLGGPTRTRIPAYASMLGFSVEPDRAVEAALDYQRLGFTAQKWFFRHGPSSGAKGMATNLALARSLREALGSDYRLMFDAYMGWDLTYATDMFRALEEINPYWVEEPLPPEKIGSFRQLSNASRVRISTGEHAYTRWQVKELLDSRSVLFIQTDPDWAGGISEQMHICSLCSAYDIPVISHGSSIPTTLHIAGAQSPQTIPMIEYLVRIQDWTQHFQQTIYRPIDGMFTLPSSPGLGIDLDVEKIQRLEDVLFEFPR